MDLSQFVNVLYDTFMLDSWTPPIFKMYEKEFKRCSYERFAVDELIQYTKEELYPRLSATVEDYIEITADFKSIMSKFAKVNPRNNYMFKVAYETMTDILDLLHAMK